MAEHPNEYVLLEPLDFSGVKESFFKKEGGLEKVVSKYKGLCGPTFEYMKIPMKLPSRENWTMNFLISW